MHLEVLGRPVVERQGVDRQTGHAALFHQPVRRLQAETRKVQHTGTVLARELGRIDHMSRPSGLHGNATVFRHAPMFLLPGGKVVGRNEIKGFCAALDETSKTASGVTRVLTGMASALIAFSEK